MHPSKTTPPTVQPGDLVQVELTYQDEAERLEFVIVPDELADFPAGFLGAGTPLAQAILGEPVGAVVPYFVGDALSVAILAVSSSAKSPDKQVVARRERRYRQALEQSDRTNAMIFASSFSGKWGDYDPQAIEGWDKTEPSEDQPK